MIKSILSLSLFFVLSLAVDTANAQSRYVVDCGSATEYTTATVESGMTCPLPHGQSCTAGQVGNSYGNATCSLISEAYGTPGPSDGAPSIEACQCIDCEADPAQLNYRAIGYQPYHNYACENYYASTATTPTPTSTTPVPTVAGSQTRIVECRDSLGFTIPDSFCTGPRPIDTQLCSAPPVTSPAPIPPTCDIHYQFRNDEVATPIGTAGAWVQFINNADRDCDEMPGCGIRVGVSCASGSTDEVRVSYEFEWISQVGPNAVQQTPWSGTNGAIQWGPWAYYYQNGHTNEECRLGMGRRCGISMSAALRAGGTCDVDYQIRAEERMSPLESNGVKSYLPNMGNRNENCDDSPGCGIRATLDCGGGGGGGGGAGTWQHVNPPPLHYLGVGCGTYPLCTTLGVSLGDSCSTIGDGCQQDCVAPNIIFPTGQTRGMFCL